MIYRVSEQVCRSPRQFIFTCRDDPSGLNFFNQLIVGPCRWATQVLRQTFGERFMPESEVRIFVDRFDL